MWSEIASNFPKNMTTILRLHSSRTAAVDVLRRDDIAVTVQVLGIVGFTLLTALGASVRLYLWEVPFTLQTAAIYGSGLFLGWRNGMLSQLLYLALGLVFPVFAGEGFGAAYLLGAASAGYLLAAPVAAAVVGLLSKRWNTLTGSTLASIAGALVLFAIGVVWLHFAAGHATWFESIDKGFIRFIPVDLAKLMFVGMLYAGTRHVA
jgi:biotin transport system substrate-specific component